MSSSQNAERDRSLAYSDAIRHADAVYGVSELAAFAPLAAGCVDAGEFLPVPAGRGSGCRVRATAVRNAVEQWPDLRPGIVSTISAPYRE